MQVANEAGTIRQYRAVEVVCSGDDADAFESEHGDEQKMVNSGRGGCSRDAAGISAVTHGVGGAN